MAIAIKPGEIYECPDMRFGESSKGDWAFFSVNAKKGYDKIKVFASNPTTVRDAKAVKVVSIDHAELKSRLDERTQKWYKDYVVTCTLAPAESKQRGSDFEEASEEDIDKMFGLNF